MCSCTQTCKCTSTKSTSALTLNVWLCNANALSHSPGLALKISCIESSITTHVQALCNEFYHLLLLLLHSHRRCSWTPTSHMLSHTLYRWITHTHTHTLEKANETRLCHRRSLQFVFLLFIWSVLIKQTMNQFSCSSSSSSSSAPLNDQQKNNQ